MMLGRKWMKIGVLVCALMQLIEGGCDRDMSTEGVIESPDFPSPYATSLKCKIRVHAPPRKIIRFNILRLDLPSPKSNGACRGDKLILFDGTNGRAPLLAKLCGNSFSTNYYTTQSEGFIRFNSDDVNTGNTGFKLKVFFDDQPTFNATTSTPTTTTMTPEPRSGCSRDMSTEGAVLSPGFPTPYGTDLKCKIKVHAPSGKIIRFNMQELDLPLPASNGACRDDKLSIYDGTNARAPLIVRLCGNSYSTNYYTTQSEGFIKFLTDSTNTDHTGFKLKVFFIDRTPDTTTTTTTLAPSSTTSLQLNFTVNWFDGECGRSMYSDAGDMTAPAPRIVNGRNARSNEFPWQAALVFPAGSLRCGAVIINENWILTAAHCLVYNTHLVVGAHNLMDIQESNRQERELLEKFLHPEYRGATLDHDIALVKLADPIQLSNAVRPICPPTVDKSYVHHTAIVSGWGYVDNEDTLPTVLQYVALNITEDEYCREQYTETSKTVTDVMFCTDDNRGNTEYDACTGDSGGPVAVKQSDGTFVLVGLVSWGFECAAGKPGVNTKVSVLMEWIQSVLDAN